MKQLEIDPKAFDRRRQRSHYDEWVTHARAMDVPEENITKQVDLWVHEAESLAAGKCPKCGEPATRYVNYDYQPHSATLGTFVMYRCSTQPPPGTLRPKKCCDFMVDLLEPGQGS